jgi:two-component system cell cycle response regulator DivK
MAAILVVEDNHISLKLATLLLKNAGHAVLQAHDGEAAISVVHTQMPDLILMDVQMSGMDGLTATRLLKRNPITAAIPIIALTAFAMRGDEEKILSAGCDDYIAKPYHYPDFLAKVDKILNRNQAGKAVMVTGSMPNAE